MDWYLKVLKNYFNFEGRARRKEYWMFVLVNLIVSFGLSMVDGIVGLKSASGIGTLGAIYSLAVLVPSIAVGARRLHDLDKSGWWQLIAFVPIIGWIVLIVWAASAGQAGSNRFGPDPKLDGGAPAMA
ncbi:DUF805 domain-containing protein [Cognatiluteimonas profundi]|uniref:DUF805 domain-containing protein n=1 Tax=Cognatiluteimonas profundi TaxID=2594501 RepID=UPI00131E005E|nr:DUF805 domain-containing protein [Lysobacter profundi]